MLVTTFGHLDHANQMGDLALSMAGEMNGKGPLDRDFESTMFGTGYADQAQPETTTTPTNEPGKADPSRQSDSTRETPKTADQSNEQKSQTSTAPTNHNPNTINTKQGTTESNLRAGGEPATDQANTAGSKGATVTPSASALNQGVDTASRTGSAAALTVGKTTSGSQGPGGNHATPGKTSNLRPGGSNIFKVANKPPVTPTREIPRALGETIIKRISLFTNPDGREALLDLDPPELGRLGVRLSFAGKQVNLHLHAANENVAAFLGKNIEALRQSFTDLGMTVDKVTVTDATTGESHTQFTNNTDGRPYTPRSATQHIKTPDPEGQAKTDKRNNVYYKTDGNSVLDIIV